MFEYLECLMDGLKLMVGDKLRVPDRHRYDPDEPCTLVALDLLRRWLLAEGELHTVEASAIYIRVEPLSSREKNLLVCYTSRRIEQRCRPIEICHSSAIVV